MAKRSYQQVRIKKVSYKIIKEFGDKNGLPFITTVDKMAEKLQKEGLTIVA